MKTLSPPFQATLAALPKEAAMAGAAVPRRRGRPALSIDVAAKAQRVSLEQFSALRAFLSGVEPLEASRRFLSAGPPPGSETAALQRLARIMEAVIETARQRPGDTTEIAGLLRHLGILGDCLQHTQQRRRRQITALRQRRLAAAAGREAPLPLQGPLAGHGAGSTTPPPKVARPAHLRSLDAFIEHYIASRLGGEDPELSEAEWQELFAEADEELRAGTGVSHNENLEPHDAPAALQLQAGERLSALAHAELTPEFDLLADLPQVPRGLALNALEACRFTVDRHPRGSDRVDTWFTPTTVKRLHAADLHTLQALADRIERRGERWWTEIPGLGARRAMRAASWMADVARIEATGPEPGALPYPAFAAMPSPPVGQSNKDPLVLRLALLQLEPLAGWLHGYGPSQVDRATTREDLAALCAVLEAYRDRPSTQAVYCREALRFALWCYSQGHGLRTLASSCVQEFEAFLQDIPPSWIQSTPSRRGQASWRPFRGQLDEASRRKALASVQVVLKALAVQQGIVASVVAVTLTSSRPPSIRASLSLGEHHWSLMRERLETGAPTATRSLDQARAPLEAGGARSRVPTEAKRRRVAALVHLIRATGLTREECVTARLSDLSMTGDAERFPCTLRVVGRGQRVRLLSVPNEVVDMIMAHLNDRSGIFRDDQSSREGRSRIPLISVLEHSVRSATGSDPNRAVTTTAAQCGSLTGDGLHAILKAFFAECARTASARGQEEVAEAFHRASWQWLR